MGFEPALGGVDILPVNALIYAGAIALSHPFEIARVTV
jgi:hypothetical protein